MQCKTSTWLVLMLLVGSLTGCGDQMPEADFRFVTANEHNTFDPQRMSWSHDIRLANQLYEPLVYYDFAAGELEPAAAKSWSVSEDRKTYTFQIREAARWSNGDPVTAKDYIFAWRRALTPGAAADYTKLFYHIKGAKAFFDWRQDQLSQYREIAAQAGASNQTGSAEDAARETWKNAKAHFANTVGLSAPGPKTLKVTLNDPTPYFLEIVSFTTFVPNHRPSARQAMQFNGQTGMVRVEEGYWSDPKRVVTNGAYQLAERGFKRYTLLSANEHYWNRGAMRNDSLLEKIIGDPQNALLTYENGQADWLPDLPSAKPLAGDLAGQNRPDVHTQTMAGTYFYTYNCQPTLPDGSDNPLHKTSVRRALSMAIDRQQLTQRVTPLNLEPAYTYVPPKALKQYEAPTEAGARFDPEQARQLLREAGHPEGEGLDGLTLTYNTGQGHARVAQAVQQMWQRHLKINIRLEGVPLKQFRDRLASGRFEIARASWFGDYPDPTTWLQKMSTGDGNNDGRWSNERFDQLLQQASGQTGAQRMQTLREAERVLLQEQPLALIYYYKNVYVYDPEQVSGLEPTGWSRWPLDQVSVQRMDN
jgi:oligopeptide transport system substrate-binding protein